MKNLKEHLITEISMIFKSTGLSIKVWFVVKLGQFFEDSKNGNGVLYLSNGERFEGEFVNDAIHGEGIFIK